MRMNKLADAEYWYRESLRAKPDHIPAHLTYGKLLAMTVRSISRQKTDTSGSISQDNYLFIYFNVYSIFALFFLDLRLSHEIQI